MRGLFFRTLVTILAALLILVTTLAAVSLLGLQRSIGAWDSERSSQLKAVATQILREPSTSADVPGNTPLFVYSADGRLVFSNRGAGARLRAPGAAVPVVADGRLLGSYLTGTLRFGNDAANGRFLESLHRSLWLGLLFSLAIAAGFALLFSRNLSIPAVRVALALDRITQGDLETPSEVGGAREIADIGASANRLRVQLLRERELRRQWAHDVTHDLRTPVAAVSAQIEGMRDGVLDLSSLRLDKVLRELSRVQELITDLEELMRLESPEMRISVESFDPAPLVETVRERFEHLFIANGIRFRAEVQPVQIRADRSLVQRAVSNFVANAVRHCREGGSVSVTVEERTAAVAFRVANSGDPIPEEELPRVFDRLFRGEYARNSAGSGLGLTIARRIAELHRGDLRIDNRPDGVVVELVLPRTEGAP